MASHAAQSAVHDALRERGSSSPSLPAGTLEDATRRVIRSRPASEIARETGIPERMLQRYAAPVDAVDEHRPIPSRAIVPVTLATGRFEILDAMEYAVGRIAVPRPTSSATPATLTLGVSCITREFAGVQHATAQALTDDRLTDEERAALDAELRDLVRAAESLRLLVAGGRKPGAKVGAR